jgi:calmodulin
MSEVSAIRLRELFTKYDTDRDNSIVPDELRGILKELGEDPTDEQFTEMMSKTDQDGNGKLDLDEFLLMMNCRKTVVSEEAMVAAFRVFDRDGDGKLTLAEFERIMRNLNDRVTQDEVQELLQQAGATAGLIDYAKFIHTILAA